ASAGTYEGPRCASCPCGNVIFQQPDPRENRRGERPILGPRALWAAAACAGVSSWAPAEARQYATAISYKAYRRGKGGSIERIVRNMLDGGSLRKRNPGEPRGGGHAGLSGGRVGRAGRGPGANPRS